ncbi:MAG TPA: hypothetical protein VHW23_04395 [Kofleriaceae bacterium]|jgi:hypothetical protein|nr:hypothetical protein [Kofleriaceae bacterium]
MVRSGWVVLVLAVAAPAYAEGPPTPFDQGRVSINLAVTEQTAFDTSRFGLGAGVGYFVLDGLELGAFGMHMFGSGPSLDEVSPSISYTAQPLVGSWPVVPYVGAFYNHWFVGDGLSDIDALGARAGLVRLSGQLIIGFGIAYERTVSTCSSSCDTVYPDITFGFTF